MIRSLFFVFIIAFVNAYPLCNDINEQHKYFENERQLFNIHESQSPFDADFLFDTTRFQVASCMDNNGEIYYPAETSCAYISNNTHLELQKPTYRFPLFDSFIWKLTDTMWYLSGWTKIIENGEHYWYYPNKTSNKTIFFLHGINAVNGFENILLLRKLTREATVYFSVYSPVLYFDTNYEYNNTYSQHIVNIASFIKQHKTDDTDIIGNSYGSIRLTTLCKRFPELCDKMSHIILTDPLNVNLPFSKMFDACLYGVFFIHSEKTPIYRKSITINTLRLQRQYTHMYENMDWYEWSIDTDMMKRFSHNMVLVIGNYDKFIVIDRESPAMKLCRVIYTDTQHGMVIFSDFMEQIYNTCPN
jgi:pimeloyl-ACP methyl ester carboxylesterase